MGLILEKSDEMRMGYAEVVRGGAVIASGPLPDLVRQCQHGDTLRVCSVGDEMIRDGFISIAERK